MQQPIALTDSQITTIMQLSRPLQPDQRIAFIELLTSKLNGREIVGDGELHRLCRGLIKEHRLFDPPDVGVGGRKGTPVHTRKTFERRSAIGA